MSSCWSSNACMMNVKEWNLMNYLYGHVNRTTTQVIKNKWCLKNGTVIVGPCTFNECREKMFETTRYNTTFYASQLIDGLYEVQFSNELHPDVVVIVSADSGMEAGIRARHILAADYADTKVLA